MLARGAARAGAAPPAPLLKPRSDVKSILVVVLTSDRGLCGPFNNGLIRKTSEWLTEKSGSARVTVRVYGRKGSDGLKKQTNIERQKPVLDYFKADKLELVRPLANEMVEGFVDGTYDEVWVAYNRFVNTLVQTPTFDRVLPLTLEKGADVSGDYRYEPTGPEILGALLPLYLRTLLLQSFLETEAGMYAAQMTAMDNAKKNASELIDRLTLDFNRARQAAITTEIIEIVAGAQAL